MLFLISMACTSPVFLGSSSWSFFGYIAGGLQNHFSRQRSILGFPPIFRKFAYHGIIFCIYDQRVVEMAVGGGDFCVPARGHLVSQLRQRGSLFRV